MKWFLAVYFWRAVKHAPIFCLFPDSPVMCTKPPIPQLGNQPYYSPVTNNQHSLPTTQHYILPHLPAISGGVCLCVLRWFRLCTMNCEHSGLNLLVAARLSVSNLVNELYGQIVCWCYLGPCNLALSRPTVKFREVLLSAWCGAPTMSTQPITSPSAINMYAVLLLSLSMPLWRTWWSQPTPCQGEGHSRNWV